MMSSMSSSPDDIYDEVAMARKLRRLKRKLLLNSADATIGCSISPTTLTSPTERMSSSERSFITPKMYKDEDSDSRQQLMLPQLPFPSLQEHDEVKSSLGIRKLRRIKRRLLLETAAAAASAVASPRTPTTTLTSVKNCNTKGNGANLLVHHDVEKPQEEQSLNTTQRQESSKDDDPTVTPVRLLRRIKRRLFLDSLLLDTTHVSSSMVTNDDNDDDFEGSSGSMNRPLNHDSTKRMAQNEKKKEELPPHLWLKAWSDKVDVHRGLSSSSSSQIFSLKARPKEMLNGTPTTSPPPRCIMKKSDMDNVESKFSGMSVFNNSTVIDNSSLNGCRKQEPVVTVSSFEC